MPQVKNFDQVSSDDHKTSVVVGRISQRGVGSGMWDTPQCDISHNVCDVTSPWTE